MALNNNPNRDFFDKKEILDRQVREEMLFKEFSQSLKKITSLSIGWKKILDDIDLNNIKNRDDLNAIPITRKSSLDLQKNNYPYGNLTTKPSSKFPYMFASPGPIYEPGDYNDFWNMSRSLHAAGLERVK